MTTDTTVVFESTEGMSDLCRFALRNTLLACSDTKLLLGYHYGEWTFGPPELEAAVACCSLAQTELGHVRLLQGILKKQFGDDPDALVARDANDFANVAVLDTPIPDWASLVAVNYVVDLGTTRLLHAMQGSSFKPVRMSVDKMLDEERYHIHHGQGWFRTLANRNAETKAAIAEQLAKALDSVAMWMGPAGSEEEAELVASGVKSKTNDAILADLVADIATTAAEVGLTVKMETPDFTGWNAANRRTGGGGPDEEILYHLRGSKNEIFKLN